MSLTHQQVETLLQPIKPNRVHELRGQSHVPAYDVTAHLTRIFGFAGWDKKVLNLVKEVDEQTATREGKPAWTVTYTCTMRLTVKDCHGNAIAEYEDGAAGSSTQPQHGEAIDMAMKSAISYALKRCAKDLGDQFGLSLYNNGKTAGLVMKTLVMPEGEGGAVDLESHIPIPESEGNDERRVEEQEPTELVTVSRLQTTEQRPSSVSQPSNGRGSPMPPAGITDPQVRNVNGKFAALGIKDRTKVHEQCSAIVGVPIMSVKDLTKAQAHKIIDTLQAELDHNQREFANEPRGI